MSRWNRLFVIVAICWALVAPFLVMKEVNRPVHEAFDYCGRAAYRNFGASDSRVRLDMDRYNAEVKQCAADFVRDFRTIQELAAAMIGAGDWTRDTRPISDLSGSLLLRCTALTCYTYPPDVWPWGSR
jgi:hypothetical protein